jgi:hypothetical protein
MASSIFTVGGSSEQIAHVVAYGATVSLALVSATGVYSCAYSFVGSSYYPATYPTITYGTSMGDASFTFQSDPGGGAGRSLILECLINGGYDSNGKIDSSLRTRRLVGAANDLSFLPIAAGETTERDVNLGWLKAFNDLVAIMLPS